MAIYRKVNNGIYYFSIYVPGSSRRIRGSTGKYDRAEALLVEQTMRLATSRKSPKDHILKIIDALYADTESDRPDIPLEAVVAECERIGRNAGKRPSKYLSTRRGYTVARLGRWLARWRPDIKGARGIDRQAAQAFAAALEREGISDKTRAGVVGELASMWNILRREHDGIENPWPLARPMHVASRRREAFSVEEAQRVFAAADRAGHGWGLASRIAAATGLRYGDIAHLKYGDVVGDSIMIKPRKTQSYGISVAIPLPHDLRALIGTGEPSEWILPEHAEGYGRGWVGKHPFSAILREAGIDPARGYTFHSFRHFFRTQLSRAGVSDEIAMKLGGWTQRTTADRYDHDGRAKEKAAAVAAAWALTKNEAD